MFFDNASFLNILRPFILMFVVSTGCATGAKAPPSLVHLGTLSSDRETEAERQYREAEKAYASKDYVATRQYLKTLAFDYADSPYAHEAYFMLVQVEFDDDRLPESRSWLKELKTQPWSSRYADRIDFYDKLLAGEAAVDQKPPSFEEPAIDDNTTSTTASLELTALGQRYITLCEAVRQAVGHAAEGEARQQLSDFIDKELTGQELARLAASTEALSELGGEDIMYKVVRLYKHMGDRKRAIETGRILIGRYPQGRWKQDTNNILIQLEAQTKVSAQTIGIILPLSGQFKSYGQRVLASILIGFGVRDDVLIEELSDKHRQRYALPNGLTLLVRDTKADPIAAESLVIQLVEQEHVTVILGDILRETAQAAARRAEMLGVPMITFSRGEALSKIGPWIFQASFTAEQMMNTLVQAAMAKGHQKFAILYPEHDYGLEHTKAFESAVSTNDGVVTFKKSYAYDQTTFTVEARALAGKDALAGNPWYQNCMRQARSLGASHLIKSAKEKCRKNAPPGDLDYDAIFIPDTYKRVSYIVPALVAEDLLVSNDPAIVQAYRDTTKGRVKQLQLLGGHLWHNDDLTRRVGRQIRGALLVDDMMVPNDDGEAGLKLYMTHMNNEPDAMAFFAHDISAWLKELLGKGGSGNSRELLLKALRQDEFQSGWSERIQFDTEGGLINRPLIFGVGRHEFYLNKEGTS